MQRFALGDFELMILSDGCYYADGGAMFGVIPRVLWERRIPPDARNRIPLAMNSLLVRDGRRTVLIETGAGNKLPDKAHKIYQNEARLLDSFAAAKIAPDEVDIVINTHLHFDHCGWNTVYAAGRLVPTFPRARYYVQRGEWEHAQTKNVRDRVSYLSENYNPLLERGQMELISGDREIVPGISVRLYPGHTRHMQAVMIRSGGQTACYISDLIPMTAHLDLTWGMGYDLFPLEVIEQKRRFYAEAIPERWLVCFTHEARTPMAYLEEGEHPGRYVARAATAANPEAAPVGTSGER